MPFYSSEGIDFKIDGRPPTKVIKFSFSSEDIEFKMDGLPLTEFITLGKTLDRVAVVGYTRIFTLFGDCTRKRVFIFTLDLKLVEVFNL